MKAVDNKPSKVNLSNGIDLNFFERSEFTIWGAGGVGALPRLRRLGNADHKMHGGDPNLNRIKKTFNQAAESGGILGINFCFFRLCLPFDKKETRGKSKEIMDKMSPRHPQRPSRWHLQSFSRACNAGCSVRVAGIVIGGVLAIH